MHYEKFWCLLDNFTVFKPTIFTFPHSSPQTQLHHANYALHCKHLAQVRVIYKEFGSEAQKGWWPLIYSSVPQPPDHGPITVHGSIGTGRYKKYSCYLSRESCERAKYPSKNMHPSSLLRGLSFPPPVAHPSNIVKCLTVCSDKKVGDHWFIASDFWLWGRNLAHFNGVYSRVRSYLETSL